MSTILHHHRIKFNRRDFFMDKSTTVIPICRSVFQKDAPTTTTEKYTQIWITLINQIEKSKKVLAEVR